MIGTFDCRIGPLNRKKNQISKKDTYYHDQEQFNLLLHILFFQKKMFVPLTFSADLVYLPSSLNLVGSHS